MISIRKAIPEDGLGIALVNVYTWKTTYAGLIPESFINSRIENVMKIAERNRSEIAENNNYIVATVDNTIVGFACFGKVIEEEFTYEGTIHALYVLSGFQGKGVGKMIFNACIEELKNLGCNSLIVNCLKGNKSLEFYKHMGGKIIGKREDKVKDVVLTSDIIKLEI